ncbi:MAG: hypothetical protein NUV59_00210, partial [Patescibacteria group bacterium]|nr:hypothetical protein [Patescibacteria group bacterium]
MSDEIFFDGVRYIAAREAADEAGFTRDYIARLCKEGRIVGRRAGKNWYVNPISLKSFSVEQQHARALRSKQLVRERAQEYRVSDIGDARRNAAIQGAKAGEISGISTLNPEAGPQKITDKLKRSLAQGAAASFDSVASLVGTPMGGAHAALHATYVSAHTVNPVVEFLHKLTALTLAFLITFGTYALVDPQYARYAADSIGGTARSLANAAADAGDVRDRAQTQLALAAGDPAGTLASLARSVPLAAASLARMVNSAVDDFVYAIAFPADLLRSRGIAANARYGSVSVEIKPYARIAGSPQPAADSRWPASNQQSTVNSTVINQPVIERTVETRRVVVAGGITREELDAALANLNDDL